jgi:leucyl aminopeptidase
MLVLPYWKGKKQAESAAEQAKMKIYTAGPIESHDFTGSEGELLILYVKEDKEKRIALLGLGDPSKITVEKLRRAYSLVAKASISKKLKTVNLLLPKIPGLANELLIQGVAEGLLLSNYAFTKLKHDTLKESPTHLLQQANLIGADKEEVILAAKYNGIFEGVYLARDLVNDNADNSTPQHLVKAAQELAKKHGRVTTRVLDKKQIEKAKMGLLLAVNRGSHLDPALVMIEYKGDPKSKDHTVLVGKGITYDTGGLNLKMSGMETMKSDMGGAAVCLGTVAAAATLGLKVNFTAIFPATENSISSKSYKPGDVYTSFAGTTVEIGDTDAEGRLVLADALAYAVKHLHPTRIIDFATLTGSIEVALGPEAAGLFSNDDALADSLIRAGTETFERLWRMPLYEEYRDNLKSEVADMRNVGGRKGGASIAGKFLETFVDKTPWAHCDIAATAFLPESKRYLPRHGTGMGVRLMIRFFENQIEP